jgi:hypothetical protein
MPKPPREGEKDLVEYIKTHPKKTDREVAQAFGLKFYDVTNTRIKYGILRNRTPIISIKQAIENDKKLQTEEQEGASIQKKYDYLLHENDTLKEEMDAVLKLREQPKIRPIVAEQGSGTSEATAIVLASDWHIEEEVRASEVNDLNEFTLDIARQRTTKFFQRFLKLVRMAQKNVAVTNAVLALLGDFISGSIHEELMEINQLSPSDAIVEAQNIIISGIDFLLNNSTLTLTIPCKSGNHGRTTKKVRHATEEGNSLEAFMYHNLAIYYRNESRVRFIISNGYHIYLPVYDYPVRFHHGHMMNYGGGVGGLYIPVNKAIGQWNKSIRAYLDAFGHFHQARDGGNFISNGALIGYNSYALSIKAEFEKPRQQFFLIDKKRGKSLVAPVLFD